MNARDDPEFAGRIEAKTAPPKKPFFEPDRLLSSWVVVYLANLVVPLVFGVFVTDQRGRAGMFLALPVWFGLGWCVVRAWRGFGRGLVIGGAMVAATQIVPLLQMFAGAFALDKVGNPRGRGGLSVPDEFAGFAATLITGGLLIAVALALGLPIAWFTSRGVREDGKVV